MKRAIWIGSFIFLAWIFLKQILINNLFNGRHLNNFSTKSIDAPLGYSFNAPFITVRNRLFQIAS